MHDLRDDAPALELAAGRAGARSDQRTDRAGKDKDEIKAALVDEYGSEVLAVPEASGFGLAAFLVPIGGVAIALVAVGLAARRWRRARREEPDRPRAGVATSADDEERLSADLKRYEL